MFEFPQRIEQDEWMDDLGLQGPVLDQTLDQLHFVNYWLGGLQPSVNGLKRLLRADKTPVHIADLGCGGGDTLRAMARWARKQNLSVKLTGIDANAACVEYARQQSVDFPEIDFVQQDCFAERFYEQQFDVIHCGLFLHHFDDETLSTFVPRLCQMARTGLIVNDLHRNRLAYQLFRLVCTLFRSSDMVRHDGLISIRRAFSRQDLRQLIPHTPLIQSQIRWCWAFRYQMILDTRAFTIANQA